MGASEGVLTWLGTGEAGTVDVLTATSVCPTPRGALWVKVRIAQLRVAMNVAARASVAAVRIRFLVRSSSGCGHQG